MYNLNKLFGSNDSVVSNKKTRQDLNQRDGLLFLMRQQIEEDIETTLACKANVGDLEVELNNKLDLITTQLIYNLTMPIEINSMENEKTCVTNNTQSLR